MGTDGLAQPDFFHSKHNVKLPCSTAATVLWHSSALRCAYSEKQKVHKWKFIRIHFQLKPIPAAMRFKCCETKPDGNGEGGNRASEREREWKWSVCCRIWFNVNCKWAKDTEIVETIYSRERFRFGLTIDKSATYRVVIDNNLHCAAMMPRLASVCVFVRSFLYCFLSFIPLFISLRRSASISPVDIPFSFSLFLSETKKKRLRICFLARSPLFATLVKCRCFGKC